MSFDTITRPTTMPMPSPTADFAGSNQERESVGLPGHCEDCAMFGHVVAHPDLGCGDVGCNRAHGPEDEDDLAQPRIFVTGHFPHSVTTGLQVPFELQFSEQGEDARDLIGSCQALVADVSAPAIEVGLHIAHARSIGVPVLLVAVGRVPNAEVLDAGSRLLLLASHEAGNAAAVGSGITTALRFLGIHSAA